MNSHKEYINVMDKETSAIILSLLGLLLIPGFAYVIVIILLFLTIIFNNEWYLKSLIYMTLLKFLNPIFDEINNNIYYLILFIFFILITFNISKKQKISINSLERKFYFLLVLFFITSSMNSFFIDLSIIKLTIYGILVFVVFQSLQLAKEYDFISFLIKLMVIYIWISLILMFTSYGYFINGLFMGMTQHSQSLGIIITPILVLFSIKYFRHEFKHSLFYLLTMLIGVYEIYLTGSRTALFAMIFALIIYVMYRLIMIKKYSKKFIVFMPLVLIFSVFIYSVFSDKINNSLSTFVSKSYNSVDKSNQTAVIELGKRGLIIEASIENFLKQPWTGIGFGVQTVYSDPLDAENIRIKFIPGTNIIYNKPLEKGNLYVAVFEEGGIIVGLYFLVLSFFLFFSLFTASLSYGWVSLLSMYISFNGEAALFASGGLGAYQLAFIAILFSISKKYKRV